MVVVYEAWGTSCRRIFGRTSYTKLFSILVELRFLEYFMQTIGNFKKPGAWLRAFVLSSATQVVSCVLYSAQMGDLAGFRKLLGVIGALLLTPFWFVEILLDGAPFPAAMFRVLSWIVQFTVWYTFFFIYLKLRETGRGESNLPN